MPCGSFSNCHTRGVAIELIFFPFDSFLPGHTYQIPASNIRKRLLPDVEKAFPCYPANLFFLVSLPGKRILYRRAWLLIQNQRPQEVTPQRFEFANILFVFVILWLYPGCQRLFSRSLSLILHVSYVSNIFAKVY